MMVIPISPQRDNYAIFRHNSDDDEYHDLEWGDLAPPDDLAERAEKIRNPPPAQQRRAPAKKKLPTVQKREIPQYDFIPSGSGGGGINSPGRPIPPTMYTPPKIRRRDLSRRDHPST